MADKEFKQRWEDEKLFEMWWAVESLPGTFDKVRCKAAFLAGLKKAREEFGPKIIEPYPTNENRYVIEGENHGR